MSHFTVLVIGDNPEEQLAPFDENLRTEFKDESKEYKEQYLNETVQEFYCESHSSWGQQITQELYNKLRASKVGRVILYDVKKEDTGIGSYFKRGCKYRGYYELPGHKRCKGSQWFEVDEVLETTHPDNDVCFEGRIRIRKIAKPKEITLKDKYPNYEDYLKDWHGLQDTSVQGYHFNPNAKWDWYQLGGRWAGFFKLKPRAVGIQGNKSWTNEDEHIDETWVDQARKGDIDFDTMRERQFEEATETYNEFKSKLDAGEMTPGDGYFHYGVENKGDRDNYIPETREEYLNRRVGFSTFAVLKDGKWYEKGEMGWWGIVSDEKEVDKWHEEFNKLVNDLPDNTLLSIYDCHI